MEGDLENLFLNIKKLYKLCQAHWKASYSFSMAVINIIKDNLLHDNLCEFFHDVFLR